MSILVYRIQTNDESVILHLIVNGISFYFDVSPFFPVKASKVYKFH